MKECLFCKMIKGEVPTNTIYEDDKIKVFLDINPVTNGHMLVIPKTHHETIMDIDPSTISYMAEIIQKKLYPLLQEKLNVKGLTMMQNNNYGQEVPHFHIHLIPRYANDKVHTCHSRDVEDINTIFQKLTQ